jgi:hypothetical protein
MSLMEKMIDCLKQKPNWLYHIIQKLCWVWFEWNIFSFFSRFGANLNFDLGEKFCLQKDISIFLIESPSQSQVSTKTYSPAEYELYQRVEKEAGKIKVQDGKYLNMNEFHTIVNQALEAYCETKKVS